VNRLPGCPGLEPERAATAGAHRLAIVAARATVRTGPHLSCRSWNSKRGTREAACQEGIGLDDCRMSWVKLDEQVRQSAVNASRAVTAGRARVG
jgi:hypothetical protein